MAYVDEKNAGYRITGVAHGVATTKGNIRVAFDEVVDREVIQADENNFPVSRPINGLDQRIVVAFMDMTSQISRDADPADVAVDFTEAGGDAGSLECGEFVASSVANIMGRSMGGFNGEQTFELEGPPSKTWLQ